MLKKVVLICALAVSSLLPAIAFADDSLHKAAHSGDIESVRKILKTKVNPDARDSFGGTALHAAMFQKNLEIVTLLINYGINVNAQGPRNGYTPLHDAVWANNPEAAKILLANGAKTDIKGKEGLTPYEKAVKENKKEMAELLKPKSNAPKV
jgi:uncharacterized protein